MEAFTREEIVRAFHMMWDNYPEMVRLIDRHFNVIAGNPLYLRMGGQEGVRCNTGDPSFHRGCQAMNALKTQETKSISSEIGGTAMESFWVPVAGAPDYYVHYTNGLSAFAAAQAAAAARDAAEDG